jgi:hypothetical protein
MRYGLCGCDAFVQLASWYGIEGSIGWLQRLLWHYQQEQGCILPWGILEHRERFTQFFTFVDDRNVEMTELSKYWLLGKAKAKPVRAAKNTGFSIGFRAFWEVYPRKKAIHDAWKAWQQMESFRPNDDQICAAVNRQLQSKTWKDDDGKWIPHPASWLRAGRWADEVKMDNGTAVKYNGDDAL